MAAVWMTNRGSVGARALPRWRAHPGPARAGPSRRWVRRRGTQCLSQTPLVAGDRDPGLRQVDHRWRLSSSPRSGSAGLQGAPAIPRVIARGDRGARGGAPPPATRCRSRDRPRRCRIRHPGRTTGGEVLDVSDVREGTEAAREAGGAHNCRWFSSLATIDSYRPRVGEPGRISTATMKASPRATRMSLPIGGCHWKCSPRVTPSRCGCG